MLHDEQLASYGNNKQTISSREQRLIEQIKVQWLNTHEPTPETLTQILRILPTKYKTMAISAVAERFVNTMKLHLLQIIAIFYQQAEDEGIDSEERDETLQDIETEVCHLMELDHRLAIETLEELFKLGKITASAQTLSQYNDAEEAQRWLYNLPTIYQGRLEREHLTNKGFVTVIKLPQGYPEIQVKLAFSPPIGTLSRIEEVRDQNIAALPGSRISKQWGEILLPRLKNSNIPPAKAANVE